MNVPKELQTRRKAFKLMMASYLDIYLWVLIGKK